MAPQSIPRPPGPAGGPMLARALLRGDPMAEFERLAREHPRITHFRLGREHVYVLDHPELVHELFGRYGRAVRKGRTSQQITRLLGDGLLTSEGEIHRAQRRAIQPLLHGARVRAYVGAMHRCIEDLERRWQPGATVDMAVEMPALTLAIVGRSLFGTGLPDTDLAEVADCLGTLLGGSPWQLVPGADTLLSLPLPANRRRLDAARRLDSLVRRLIRQHSSGPSDPCLLSALLRTGMAAEQLRDETLTLLLAGHETTATALGWTWSLLSDHPAAAAWLHEELDRTGDVAELHRTRAVIAEAMRLYPPSWVLARRVIEPVELDGWRLPTGSLVVASQWALHRDRRFWREPAAFRPYRWITSDGGFELEAPGQPRAAYLPFGIGARSCVGREFAWTEAVLVLARLGRRWAPQRLGDSPVEVRPALTLRPRDGLPMRLRSR